MPRLVEPERRDGQIKDNLRVLETRGLTSVIMRETQDGDLAVTQNGPGGLWTDNFRLFAAFDRAHVLFPRLRTALPPLAELYPESTQPSTDSERHLVLPGEKRINTFRTKWLHPIGANTLPVVFREGDIFKKEMIEEQTAAGNLIAAMGETSPEYPIHDLTDHLFGDSAIPDSPMRAFQYVAQQIPDLAKNHPDAAHVVRVSVAQSLDDVSDIPTPNDETIWLPSLDILNRLILRTVTLGFYYGKEGGTAINFVKNALNEADFEAVRGSNIVQYTKKELPNGRNINFVDGYSEAKKPNDIIPSLIVPKELELLSEYVPNLVKHLQTAPVSDPESSRPGRFGRLFRRRAA